MMSLPGSAQPRVSVVILAWKLVEPLRACIASVVDSQFAGELEVIIVANGATDEVLAVVDEFAGRAIVAELPQNVGFGAGCNAGAALARGDYVVFLNDDAVASPDWLAHLVGAADDSGAGAVGSLLLNADGTVQEAGSQLRADAGTEQLGDGWTVEVARSAGLLHRRNVDYASGAALLVPRALFLEVGGFDPLFAPAYFEDVDLCLRIRAHGRDVIVEPTAVVTHARGGSTSTARRFRDFIAQRSGDAFSERWRDTLAGIDGEVDADAAGEVDREQSESQPAEPTGPREPAKVALSDVERLPEARLEDSSLALETAVATQRAYAAHLERTLADQEQREQREVSRLTSELAAARAEAERAGARAAELVARLQDLETRGPIGIVKWQAGVVQKRLRRDQS